MKRNAKTGREAEYARGVTLLCLAAKTAGLAVRDSNGQPKEATAPTAVNLNGVRVHVKDAARLAAVKPRTLNAWLYFRRYASEGRRCFVTMAVADVLKIIAANQPAILDWMTLQQAAKHFQAPSATIRSWWVSGKITGAKDICDQIRIDPESHEALRTLCARKDEIQGSIEIQIDGQTYYALIFTANQSVAIRHPRLDTDSPTFKQLAKRRYFTLFAAVKRIPRFQPHTKIMPSGRIYVSTGLYTLFANMISVTEAAKMCGVSASTIRSWHKAGRVRIHRIEGMDNFLLMYEFEPVWTECIVRKTRQRAEAAETKP